MSTLTEEDQELLNEAIAASEELRGKLSKIKVKVSGKTNQNVIEAIKQIFGESYINSEGDSYITYDMYCSVVNLSRSLGTITTEEYVN